MRISRLGTLNYTCDRRGTATACARTRSTVHNNILNGMWRGLHVAMNHFGCLWLGRLYTLVIVRSEIILRESNAAFKNGLYANEQLSLE